MQTYLKSKPAGVQLLLFLGIACASGLIVIGLGGFVLSALTGISINQMGTDYGGRDSAAMLLNLRGLTFLQFLGLFFVPSLFYARQADPAPGRYLGNRHPWTPLFWVLGCAALLVALPLVEWTGLINQNVHFPPSLADKINDMQNSATRVMKMMIADRSVANLLVNIFFIAILAGIGEEFFFRGVIQRILIRGFRSPWAGIILTGAFFSFFHFEFYGFLPRFLLGILLGAAYWYSGSIWVSVVAHSLFNTVQLVAAWYRPDFADGALVKDQTPLTLLPAAAVSLVVTAAVIWLMKKRSASSYREVFADELHPSRSTNELNF